PCKSTSRENTRTHLILRPIRVPSRSFAADFIEGLQLAVANRKLAPMIIELVNTGSELMLGRVLNTHQQWLCRQLADLGYVVSRQVAVPDTAKEIQLAVRESLSRRTWSSPRAGLAQPRMTSRAT